MAILTGRQVHELERLLLDLLDLLLLFSRLLNLYDIDANLRARLLGGRPLPNAPETLVTVEGAGPDGGGEPGLVRGGSRG